MLRSIAMDADALGAGDAARGVAHDAAARVMDQTEFRALYEQAAPRLRGYLRRAVGSAGPSGDAALADDLLQETFLKLLSTRLPAAMLASPDAERQLRAYLYRIATNLLNDHWRRAQRERRWSWFTHMGGGRRAHGEQTTHRGYQGGVAAMQGGAEPVTESHDSALSVDMGRAFARLKPQEQSLLWLAYVEGFDHAEIAAAVNVGERSVRVLLHRARGRLAEMLKESV